MPLRREATLQPRLTFSFWDTQGAPLHFPDQSKSLCRHHCRSPNVPTPSLALKVHAHLSPNFRLKSSGAYQPCPLGYPKGSRPSNLSETQLFLPKSTPASHLRFQGLLSFNLLRLQTGKSSRLLSYTHIQSFSYSCTWPFSSDCQSLTLVRRPSFSLPHATLSSAAGVKT